MSADIVNRRRLQLELQRLDNQRLHLEDLALFEFLTRDFVVDDAEFERMDFFVLGCCEHGSDSHQMKVFHLKWGWAASEIGVHEVLASEEGFLAHLVGGEHFYHPVHHLGT